LHEIHASKGRLWLPSTIRDQAGVEGAEWLLLAPQAIEIAKNGLANASSLAFATDLV
jgi:hypothetical protein